MFRWVSALSVCCQLAFLCCCSSAYAAAPELHEQIRERVEALRDGAPPNAKPRPARVDDAVARFYEARDFAPAWQDGRREELAAALAKLDRDGLQPEDYQLPTAPRGNSDIDPGADSRAADDLAVTRRFLVALGDLYGGQLDQETLQLRSGFGLPPEDPQLGAAALAAAVDAGRIEEAFALARPAHPIYRRLQQALVELRALDARGGWPQIGRGKSIKPGMEDARVPLLRQRLAASRDLLDATAAADSLLYDSELQAAVEHFQQAQMLEADGVVGGKTVAALNVPAASRIAQLRANLERARWLLRRAHGDFVLVDVAGYRIAMFRDSKRIWNSRVQVGRPYRKTPIFDSKITYVTLNPTWTVPPTILREDVLPKLHSNPAWLKENRIRIIDAQGREVPAGKVDWSHMQGLRLRQDAGADNSLGRAVIRFPNPYNVYMHDTPHQKNFGASARAFSSGCIRVERALELVELLLNDPATWNREALDAAIATEETQSITLKIPVPVLIAYWTVDVDAEGRTTFKPDIYRRDPALIAALDRGRSQNGSWR